MKATIKREFDRQGGPFENNHHTSGPWTIEDWTYENGKRVVTTIRTNADAIAQICDLWRPEDLHGKEKMANARLIAAAPDMYEALKDLTRIIVTLGDINALNDAVKNALDAINKANGK